MALELAFKIKLAKAKAKAKANYDTERNTVSYYVKKVERVEKGKRVA